MVLLILCLTRGEPRGVKKQIICNFFAFYATLYNVQMGGTAMNGASRFCHPPTIALTVTHKYSG